MRILLTETIADAGRRAEDALAAAGHQVLRFHEPGAASFPSAGLDGSGFPLESGVDVAVTVRAHPRSTPAPNEDGVICALRRRVPVVVAGRTLFQPFTGFDVTAVAEDAVLVGAVVSVAAARRPGHEAVAAAEATEVLERAGVTGEPSVVVRRSSLGLDVVLLVPAATPPAARANATVRVTGALREYDRAAAHIDVSVVEV
jgi:hypothetical protein